MKVLNKIENLPLSIVKEAEKIVDENHNILNPKIYLKHRVRNNEFEEILENILGTKNIDYVLFSSKSGAEPHIDKHLTHLEEHTFIIPLILPKKGAILYAEGKSKQLELGDVVKINHQKLHELKVFDTDGCVLVMASRVIEN